jgi:hypothetical protein
MEGTRMVRIRRVPGSLRVGDEPWKSRRSTALRATVAAPSMGLRLRTHGASLSAAVAAGNNVTMNYTPQIDAVIPPAPLTSTTFSSSITWQPSPPAAVIHINSTAALSFSLPLSANGHPLPGSPLPLAIAAGPVDSFLSEVTGSGTSEGEPGEWNPVRLVPRDAFRNVLAAGALAVESLSLELTPLASSLRPFVVRALVSRRFSLNTRVPSYSPFLRFLLFLGHVLRSLLESPSFRPLSVTGFLISTLLSSSGDYGWWLSYSTWLWTVSVGCAIKPMQPHAIKIAWCSFCFNAL